MGKGFHFIDPPLCTYPIITVGQPGEIIFPVGLGIGPIQVG